MESVGNDKAAGTCFVGKAKPDFFAVAHVMLTGDQFFQGQEAVAEVLWKRTSPPRPSSATATAIVSLQGC